MSEFILHPLNITINQMSIGNKKLTKTIFNQIEEENYFTRSLDFKGDAIIGYINDRNNRYLLWSKNGKLRKTNITLYYKLERDPSYAELNRVEWFLKKVGIKYSVDQSDRYDIKIHHVLENTQLYSELVDKADSFLQELTDKQIYL
ncbi:hypothetical protein [Sphingobacterium multivorum]|uniref:Uncharacterized protein n=1 Tax=Sphingobacterium multivorum TaxID=28454 RepID=A0A2X2J1K9_SPHMU|nr:hypothetical protein [Sphingobacterium multivorum]QRQ61090.1 hypothetical protein I6J33_23825 [Sphingobacterium multivorum]SPZ88247.1 Uncharacterised protein [Sphingobacterium multivorum]